MAAFVSDLTAAEIIGFYRDQCTRSDAVLAVTPLSAQPRGKHGSHCGWARRHRRCDLLQSHASARNCPR
jgi:hypothetical protein